MVDIVTLESNKAFDIIEKPQNEKKSNCNSLLRLKILCVLFAGLGLIGMSVLWQISMKANRSSKIFLSDVRQAPIRPQFGGSIFFHKSNPNTLKEYYGTITLSEITQHSEKFRLEISPREACAIESAAHHNPDQQIYVLYESPVSWIKHSKQSLLANLRTLPNVHLRNLNLKRYLLDSPFDGLIKQLESRSAFHNCLKSQITKLLGFLSLWRYGGTYLDLDTITLENFDGLGSNFAVVDEELKELTFSILNFEPFNIGYTVTKKMVRKLENYLQKELPMNAEILGRKVLNEIFAEFCNTKNISLWQDCQGLSAFDTDYFYGVPSHLNATRKSQEAFENTVTEDEYLWAVTYNWKNYFNSKETCAIFDGPYAFLAEKNCPKTFAFVKLYEKMVEAKKKLEQNN